jgi:hypothetical protein
MSYLARRPAEQQNLRVLAGIGDASNVRPRMGANLSSGYGIG